MKHVTDKIWHECEKPQFVHKLEKWIQIRQILGAVFGMGIILLFATPVVNMSQHAFEKWTPDSWWFEYEGIVPAQAEFKRGDKIEFISTAEYKRDLKVQWFDTLWCDRGTSVKRLVTQITPDQPTVKFPGQVGNPDENGNYPTWEYFAEAIPEDAIACRMNSYIQATTPLGYEKNDFVAVPWFGVNK